MLSAGAALLAARVHGQAMPARPDATSSRAGSAKRILILGGTGFIGPHFVREALAEGAHITLFNRGKRQTTPTPGVETLLGDRNGQLDALKGHDWDVVIDDSGYVPRHVQLTTQLLRGARRALRLHFDNRRLCRSLRPAGTAEGAPLKQLENPSTEDVTPAELRRAQGALREARGESDVRKRQAIVRPTYIVGPGDESDRFTYWPWRSARAEETCSRPEARRSTRSSAIDVRDRARSFVVDCALTPRPGAFNACTPQGFADGWFLIDTSRQATRARTTVHWVDAEFLAGCRCTRGSRAADETRPWERVGGCGARELGVSRTGGIAPSGRSP